MGVVYSVETVLDAATGRIPRFQPGCCHHFITGDITPLKEIMYMLTLT